MSDFFDSPVVQKAMDEINELQEQVYSEVFEFANLDKDEKLVHLNKLDDLLERQRNLYTRLSLSDDPRAVSMKETVRQSAVLMGFPKDVDCAVLFGNMQKTLAKVRDQIEP